MSPPRNMKDTAAQLDKFHHQDKDPQAKDGSSPSFSPSPPTADKSEILEAITACQTSLTTKLEEVKVDISLLHQDLQKLRHRVGSDDQTSRHIAQLQQKQDDLENCMRRNNLCFIGLPEGDNPAAFLEELLITTYGRAAFSQLFVVKRAHQMLAKKKKKHPRKQLHVS